MLGGVSTIVIVAAHNRSVALDGVGKMLAMGAATPAVMAAYILNGYPLPTIPAGTVTILSDPNPRVVLL